MFRHLMAATSASPNMAIVAPTYPAVLELFAFLVTLCAAGAFTKLRMTSLARAPREPSGVQKRAAQAHAQARKPAPPQLQKQRLGATARKSAAAAVAARLRACVGTPHVRVTALPAGDLAASAGDPPR